MYFTSLLQLALFVILHDCSGGHHGGGFDGGGHHGGGFDGGGGGGHGGH